MGVNVQVGPSRLHDSTETVLGRFSYVVANVRVDLRGFSYVVTSVWTYGKDSNLSAMPSDYLMPLQYLIISITFNYE